MANKLEQLTNKVGVQGPVVTIVMDGVGIAADGAGNAVKNAYTPTLDMLMAKYPCVKLQAHGKAVGLMSDDDMGNSEVGHNALGSGQVKFLRVNLGRLLRKTQKQTLPHSTLSVFSPMVTFIPTSITFAK